jgi:hypothetical protein
MRAGGGGRRLVIHSNLCGLNDRYLFFLIISEKLG